MVEVANESTSPPPRASRCALAGRQWLAKVTLLRRGSYRLGALRVRTGDPFGLFTSEMVVGRPTWIVVFPKVHPLPHWRLPPSPVDGSTPSRRRYEAATPLVSTVRPYVYGDAINRIHWLSSVRHGELIVKEFDLEQAADLWLSTSSAYAGRALLLGRGRRQRAASIAVRLWGEPRGGYRSSRRSST
jgi:uncharacterized protein (DUF58 family)